VSNIIIVESKNDAIFMQAMVDKVNCDIKVDPPIYIENYKSLEGLSEKKLITTLNDLKADIQREDIEKIGIILDIDNYSEPERLEWVNKCIQKVFKSETLSSTKRFIDIYGDNETNAKLACYFTNFEGKGELETLLKAIKARESPHADCLDSWRDCLKKKGKEIKQKDFDKFWIDNYIRYDTCSKKEQQQAGRKCTMSRFDYVMEHKKDIWDWDNPALDDLKEFFNLFC
jgi:hypothetical protein